MNHAWWHKIDLPTGEPTGRIDPAITWEILSVSVSGKTVLDIGARDGGYSFLAERYGAAYVLANDITWPKNKQNFNRARELLGSAVESVDGDFRNINGKFDVVLFLGVLYHLKNPIDGIQRLCKLVARDGIICIETHMDAVDYGRPAMVFYPSSEAAGDRSNWWGPNLPLLKALFKDNKFDLSLITYRKVGYKVEGALPSSYTRGVFIARHESIS